MTSKLSRLFAPLLVLGLSFAAGAQARESTPPPNTKVVGGKLALPDSWPGFAAVAVETPKATHVFCGASMISPRHALTAAHCLEEFAPDLAAKCGKTAYPIMHMRVFPGLTDLRQATRGDAFKVTRLIVHPNARCSSELASRTPTYDNDIAIIEIDRDWTGPLVAISGRADTDPSAGLVGVAGLGTTENERTVSELGRDGLVIAARSNQLLEVHVPVVGTADCVGGRGIGGGVIAANQICAGWMAASPASAIGDSCGGDSGGPLMAYDGNHRPYQVGLVSWGPTPCGQVGKPGIYTRLSQYVPWIQSVAGSVNLAEPLDKKEEAPVEPQGFAELEQMLHPARGRITIDICEDRTDEVTPKCGLKDLPEGGHVRIKVSSTLSGRLILVDRNADFQVMQLFPNEFGGTLRGNIIADQPVFFPDESYGFRIQVQAPFGPSKLMAILVPPGANLDAFVASKKTLTKGVEVSYAPGWDGENSSDLYAGNLANELAKQMNALNADKTLKGWGLATVEYKVTSRP